MDELRAYSKLQRLYPAAHFIRLETWAAMGVPDVNGCLNGVEAWIECKEVRRPSRPTTLIKHPKVRVSQIGFESKRRRAGGRTFLALMVGPDFYLLKGRHLLLLKKGMTQGFIKENSLHLDWLFDPSYVDQEKHGCLNDPLPV